MSAPVYYPGPNDALIYEIDWSNFLSAGETISTSVWSPATGITSASTSNTTTSSFATLSGGTIGQRYRVGCTITTNLGETKEASITLAILQQ